MDQGSKEPFTKPPFVMNSSIGHAEVEEVGGELDVGLEARLAETLLPDRLEDVTREKGALDAVVESVVGFAIVEVTGEEVLIESEEVGLIELEMTSETPEVEDCGGAVD